MRILPHLLTTSVALCLVLLSGCGGGGGSSATPSPTQYDVPLAQRSTSIGTSGGTLSLPDGMQATLPAGALPTATTVSVTKYSHPQDFSAEAMAYELAGVANLTKAITVQVPVNQAQQRDEISIFGYDVETGIGTEYAVTFDSAAHTATITVPPPVRTARGLLDRIRLIVEVESYYSPAADARTLAMPYYEQVSGGCWAACSQMISRAYRSGAPGAHFGQVLTHGDATDTDFGISLSAFQSDMCRFLAQESGGTVTWRGYMNLAHLRWRMLRMLDAGYPLIVRVPDTKDGMHTLVVVGYRGSGTQFVLHDPRGISPSTASDGGAYTIRDRSWFDDKRVHAMVAMQIAWPEVALPSGRTLQTLGCPGAGSEGGSVMGQLTFAQINPAINHEVPLASLRFRPSKSTGYVWASAENTVDVVPSAATLLHVALPVWNAAASAAAPTVEIALNTGATRVKTYTSPVLSLDAAIDNSTAHDDIDQRIALKAIGETDAVRRYELADANGIQPITIYATLTENGAYRDSYFVDAKLSVLPEITQVAPAIVAPSGTVTITGVCFGAVKSAKSAVTINGKTAVIKSWSDTAIQVTVPSDATSGPVVVATGAQYRYASNAMPIAVNAGSELFPITRSATKNWSRPSAYTVGPDAAVEALNVTGSVDSLADTVVTWANNQDASLDVTLKRDAAPLTVTMTIQGTISPTSWFWRNSAPSTSPDYLFQNVTTKPVTYTKTADPSGAPGVTATGKINASGAYELTFTIDPKTAYPGMIACRYLMVDVSFPYAQQLKWSTDPTVPVIESTGSLRPYTVTISVYKMF